MATTRKTPGRIAPSLDVPLLTEVVDTDTPPPAKSVTPASGLDTEALKALLTERITALADRLLQDASAEIHAALVNKVWERLREELPGIVAAALRENAKE
jgi:hypothetical protein